MVKNNGSHFSFMVQAGPSIGAGHLFRSLTLAKCLKRKGCIIHWITNEHAGDVLHQMNERAAIYRDIFDPRMLDRLPQTDYFFVDSYLPSINYLAMLKDKAPLVIMDDFRDRPVEEIADVLINYNLGADTIPYKKRKDQLRLLGPQYAFIREDYWSVEAEDGGYCLFASGASDILDTSQGMVQMWASHWLPLVIAVGPMVSKAQRSHIETLSAAKSNVAVVYAPPDFPSLVAKARFVICTSSVTAYEALSVQKPISVFQVADNQVLVGEAIEARGVGRNLGFWGTWGTADLKKVVAAPLVPPPFVVNRYGAELTAEILTKWLGGERK